MIAADQHETQLQHSVLRWLWTRRSTVIQEALLSSREPRYCNITGSVFTRRWTVHSHQHTRVMPTLRLGLRLRAFSCIKTKTNVHLSILLQSPVVQNKDSYAGAIMVIHFRAHTVVRQRAAQHSTAYFDHHLDTLPRLLRVVSSTH